MKIKALTIKDPWASFIVLGKKKIETRTWRTKYRGPLAIHVSKTVDKYALEHFGFPDIPMHKGCIIAKSKLIGIKYYYTQDEFMCDEKYHLVPMEYTCTPVNFGWILEDIEPLKKPIPCRGMPGLFEVEI
jgi:hypothetical protein